MAIKPVELAEAYRLINHGPTTMVSAKHHGVENVMSASWVCALKHEPQAKLTASLGKQTFTRKLIEQSGYFAVQVPIASQAQLVLDMGSQSRNDNPHKVENVPFFYQEGFDVPLIEGCAAWLVCKLIPEPHNQETHDLFIGEVVAAWADDRIFENGHWKFDEVGDEWKTLHYMAGQLFYRTGQGLVLK